MIILKILVSISIYNPYRNLEIRNYKSWLEWLQGTILAGTRQPSSHRHEGSAVAMAASALPIRGGSLSSPIPNMAVCQNLIPLVNIKIAGKWMFIPLKMVLIGIDPYPYLKTFWERNCQTEVLPLSRAVSDQCRWGMLGWVLY